MHPDHGRRAERPLLGLQVDCPPTPGPARFFASREDLRAWFEANHGSEREVWVGFYKGHTGRAEIVYQDVLDEALCFGWIDTTVRRLDEDRYMQRFVPRKAKSPWSEVNRRRFQALQGAGRVAAAGRAAFERASPPARTSYGSPLREFSREFRVEFRRDVEAWAFFSRRPPGYRRLAAFWVMSAKRSETQERRLGELIAASARGKKPRVFQVESTPPGGPARAKSAPRRTRRAGVK
jgi:uncharacterized protein YdeI (YjbR/CyaY-like superfamily)